MSLRLTLGKCKWYSTSEFGRNSMTMYSVTPPPNAPYTRQYFYRNNVETDSIYQISDPQYATLPLDASAATRTRNLHVAGIHRRDRSSR